MFLFGCAKKEGLVEGTVVDGQNEPLSGVTVIFNPVSPAPGAALPQARTNANGTFKIAGLAPGSEFIITLESDTWTTLATRKIKTPSGGKALTLDTPIAVRFQLLANGTVADTKTGLQWLIYAATDISAGNVINTVKKLDTGGYNDWRLPTKTEIQSLRDPTTSAYTEEPKISLNACCVWTAEINSDIIEWDFFIDDGNDLWKSSQMPVNDRVVVVRTFGAPPAAQAATIVVPSSPTSP